MSTRVVNYSLAAALGTTAAERPQFIPVTYDLWGKIFMRANPKCNLREIDKTGYRPLLLKVALGTQ